jgi:Protein of unknown function (DUF3551)
MRKMILAVLAMVIATPLIHTWSADAQNYPWHAQRGELTTCGFVSYEQCMAASRWCDRNPKYQPPGSRSHAAARAGVTGNSDGCTI